MTILSRGTEAKARILASAVLASLLLVLVPAADAQEAQGGKGSILAKNARVASLDPKAKADRVIEIPAILLATEASRYRQIFRFQEAGNWKAADRLIAQIQDPTLMGHVLAQRYLNPKAPKPGYKELKDWMAAHADHPDAPQIYKMALKAHTKGQPRPKAPIAGFLRGTGNGNAYTKIVTAADEEDEDEDRLVYEKPAKTDELVKKTKKLLKKGATKSVKELLSDDKTKRNSSAAAYDEAAGLLAYAYFVDGDDDKAIHWGEPAARRSGDPTAHWATGLAAFRSRNMDLAARHFEALANSRGLSEWMVSAGGFWAARAHLVAKRPHVVTHWLELAADHPRTFYGLLARRALGNQTFYNWDESALTEAQADALKGVAGGRRALALLQVGAADRAEAELRKLYPRATPLMAKSMLALASEAHMPGLAIRLGALVSNEDGRRHDAAAFPVPRWEPEGGWIVDRALVYAYMRQESGFDPGAKSKAGARGLMQVMPKTAKFVAGTEDRDQLHDPAYNLAVGQRVIESMLKDENVRGNLFYLAAAYNRGPGKLGKWLKTAKFGNDPLIFIESLPSAETRGFVEKVMTNYWIYQARLGQPTPSLDQLAAGEWPRYQAMDQIYLPRRVADSQRR